MKSRRANAALLGWILLTWLLGACGTQTDGSCKFHSGILRVPNHARVWQVEYEPAAVDEVRLRVTMDADEGRAMASLGFSQPESWVVFTESGPGPDYRLVVVPWSDGAAEMAWSQGDDEQDAPALFNRTDLGCSHGLGYAALPGRDDHARFCTPFNPNPTYLC